MAAKLSRQICVGAHKHMQRSGYLCTMHADAQCSLMTGVAVIICSHPGALCPCCHVVHCHNFRGQWCFISVLCAQQQNLGIQLSSSEANMTCRLQCLQETILRYLGPKRCPFYWTKYTGMAWQRHKMQGQWFSVMHGIGEASRAGC